MAKKAHTNPVDLTAAEILRVVRIRPKLALVLGSGLGKFAQKLEIAHSFEASDLLHYPKLSVEGHSGRIHFGRLRRGSHSSLPLVVFQGRVHFYETGSTDRTIFPVDLAHLLGARTLVVTNAAGGVNRKFTSGDFMLIDDFVSLTFEGVQDPGFRPQRATMRPFRPIARPFDPQLQELAVGAAKKQGLELQRGVYCWLKGPSYETPAEIGMLSRIGVDAVGMSTVPEVSRALAHGMRVLGISVISNMAAGIGGGKLSHADVTETGRRVRKNFENLMATILLDIR